MLMKPLLFLLTVLLLLTSCQASSDLGTVDSVMEDLWEYIPYTEFNHSSAIQFKDDIGGMRALLLLNEEERVREALLVVVLLGNFYSDKEIETVTTRFLRNTLPIGTAQASQKTGQILKGILETPRFGKQDPILISETHGTASVIGTLVENGQAIKLTVKINP